MRHTLRVLASLLGLYIYPPLAYSDDVVLLIDDVASDGLVTARVDLTAAARRCQKTPVGANGIWATDSDEQPVPLQFVPDADFDASSRIAGTVVLRLPKPRPTRLRLQFGRDDKTPAAWNGTVSTGAYTVTHDPKRMGGLPSRITFPLSGKTFQTPQWNNRLHHQQLGSYCLCNDPQPDVKLLAEGPLCSVVRVRGNFVLGGKRPASEPSAVYDWYYFRDRPLVFVAATIQQKQPFTWHEVHFLEMDYPREEFPRWAGGEPLEQAEFKLTNKTYPCPEWGLVHDGKSGIGMFQCGQVLLYDAGPGTYIQAHGDSVWSPWNETQKRYSAWLWIGTGGEPVKLVQAAAKTGSTAARVIVSTEEVRTRIEAAARQMKQDRALGQAWWRIEGAQQLEAQGRLEEAVQAIAGQTPAGWTIVSAGQLIMILDRTEGGIRLFNLLDSQARQRLTTSRPLPLFTISLRNAESKQEIRVSADSGWGKTEIKPVDAADPSAAVDLCWEKPVDKGLGDLKVAARATVDKASSAIRWKLLVEGQQSPWALAVVTFPQASVPDFGSQGCVLFPKGCGEVQKGVWSKPFHFTGTYPSGWTSMQFMAAYREDVKTGLYLAVHDPWGSTKDVRCESHLPEREVVLAYEHPVPDLGVPGNRFILSGEAVWQLLRGDWFDASVAYRDWVRKEAKWYPRLGPDGRSDTPAWMRELSVWALSGGTSKECVPPVQAFAKFLGPPAAVHWYSWHQIPFDNDYPHYFPTQPGFADGVRELQSSGVSVMPYINGRLWDTRDKGKEDFQFTKVALPAVTKNEKGEPYVESYGSKESDGSPVKLGAMCPTTDVWQNKVREIVLRLFNECGVKGVYIDQIAAASPTLCFDKSHGHPLGGGHWWTEGYWKLLDAIRQAMPKDRMLTTECNGEPYIRCFDGYLTWHWQYDGQVPAFPAVYGGSIQMFGRAYGGGETKDLALRMRAGQQLVFGEQIGWCAPAMAMEKANAGFFKDVVHLRRQLRRYFYAGEMARPPKLARTIPTVRADWQWGGVAWVTTDAVLTGAWHQPAEKRLVLIFVNVSDQPVTARIDYDARPYGFGGALKMTKIAPEGPGQSESTRPTLQRDVSFPARSAWAWEMTGE